MEKTHNWHFFTWISIILVMIGCTLLLYIQINDVNEVLKAKNPMHDIIEDGIFDKFCEAVKGVKSDGK